MLQGGKDRLRQRSEPAEQPPGAGTSLATKVTQVTNIDDVPGLSAPLRRAMHQAGFNTLADLDGQARTALLHLHGVGKAGLDRLAAAMEANGFRLAEGHGVWTATDRGEKPLGEPLPDEVTTESTDQSPRDWIAALPWPRRVEQGFVLLNLFEDATGAAARMWGPSMVGFGEMHYQYATGRQGDAMRVGFSPRKAALTLYGLQSYGSEEDLIAQLGKVRLGKGCIYVNKLEDIDLGVLRQLIERAWVS